MINFFNSKNRIQKIQALQRQSLIKMNSDDHNSFNKQADKMPYLPIKILSSQILAMAEQDNKIRIGKNLDIFT